MQAALFTGYGSPDVIQFRDVPVPEPKSGQVRIKVHAVAVTNSDIFIRSASVNKGTMIPFRLMIGIFKQRKPIGGLVFSGEIEKVGKNVSRYKPGEQVVGFTTKGPVQMHFGANAEYLCLPEDWIFAPQPESLSSAEATGLAYGGMLALQSLEEGELSEGMDVLIYGASGSTGTLAVQQAVQAGAKVTAVCGPKNRELVKSLGAQTVLDYTRQNELPPETRFDIVMDAVGEQKGSDLKEACRKALKPSGKYVSIDGSPLLLKQERLLKLMKWAESGNLKIIMDKIFPFKELKEAHCYVEQGHKRGNVAILMESAE